MTESNWKHFVWWKQHLLNDLNGGLLNVDEWERFIKEAYKAGMQCMAQNMQDRLTHYEGDRE